MMNLLASQLAPRIERGATALMEFAETPSPTEWHHLHGIRRALVR